jgi:hypothetical protein
MRLIYLSIICLLLISCKGGSIIDRVSENHKEQIEHAISNGSATKPPEYQSISDNNTQESIIKLQEYIAKTKALLAAYEVELDQKKKQLEQERLDKLKLISYSCAGVCLIGILVCVFLFFFSPIAKKMILTTGVACAATMALALAVPHILTYWLYFGYGFASIALLIGIYILIKYKQSLSDSKTYYDLAKSTIEKALPKDHPDYVNLIMDKHEHRTNQPKAIKQIIDNTEAK